MPFNSLFNFASLSKNFINMMNEFQYDFINKYLSNSLNG